MSEQESKRSKGDIEGAVDNTKEVVRELRAQRRFKIRINSTDSEQEDVPVGIQGHVFLIKRDTEVVVPESVVEVLRGATKTLFRQRKRADGEGNELVPYQAPRFPFEVLGEVKK